MEIGKYHVTTSVGYCGDRHIKGHEAARDAGNRHQINSREKFRILHGRYGAGGGEE